MDPHLEKEYASEYRIASARMSTTLFADILAQHAVCMVDAARPDLENHHYVQLGARLADIQSNWVELLCDGMGNSVQSDLQHQYRRVVTGIIRKFTTNLLSALVGAQPVCTQGEVAAFHTSCTTGRQVEATKALFNAYVSSLARLYQTRKRSEYCGRAIESFALAHALGARLDATIFR